MSKQAVSGHQYFCDGHNCTATETNPALAKEWIVVPAAYKNLDHDLVERHYCPKCYLKLGF